MIDKNSRKMVELLNKNMGEPSHMRLYYIKQKKKLPDDKVMEVVEEIEEKMVGGKKVKVEKKVKKLVAKEKL